MELKKNVLTPDFEIYSDEDGIFEIEICRECNKRIDIECVCGYISENDDENDDENDTRDEIECKYLDYIKSNQDDDDYEYEELNSEDEIKDDIDYIQNVDYSTIEEESSDYDENIQIVQQHKRFKKEIIVIDN